MKAFLRKMIGLIEARRQDSCHIYDLTWSIPKEYGGMTSAMLYRCWQFEQWRVGRSLTILTLQADMDVKAAQKHIQSTWKISEKVLVRNMWDDLRCASDTELLKLSGAKPRPPLLTECSLTFTEIKPYTREFKDETGTVYSREHLRKDRSVVLVVRLESNRKTTTLFDSKGGAIKQWQSVEELYLAWLEWVIGGRRALVINEHRNISKFLYQARIQNVKICQVVHGAHQQDQLTPFGELNSRANMVRNLDNFDVVSVLTEWQRQDLLDLGAEGDNIRVMPNSTKPSKLSLATAGLSRSPGKGVAVGRLSRGKQINHMLHALSKIQDNLPINLHVFGDGEERQRLEVLSAELKLNERVIFKGHVAGAQEKLTDYSFLLFTSKSEGQGLVLLEAMARGCIPIAYDMRYGPREIITPDVDGFLVPADDVDALEDTVRRFIEMPEEKRLAMRRAAIKRATYFFPENNMRRWRAVINEVTNQPPRSAVKYARGTHAVADEVVVHEGCCTVSGYLRGERLDMERPAKIIVCTRKRASFLNLDTEFSTVSETEKRFTTNFDLTHLPLRKGDYLDFYIRPIGALWENKRRIAYGLSRELLHYPGCKVYKTQYGNLSLDCKGRD